MSVIVIMPNLCLEDLKTSSGNSCLIPFYYNGEEYNECMTWSEKMWCPYDITEVYKWDYCVAQCQIKLF